MSSPWATLTNRQAGLNVPSSHGVLAARAATTAGCRLQDVLVGEEELDLL
eukprot:CAMPEP_0180748840 /NCGR_PEP_ID=MMETSP1038_2-20121128/30266_1 /TAXON_ID=632150 /ORGANISM="Azadinium spinosum, Strain 3D9" /LENGTH=49 /DNA_ID= /DNA_START= /DNA_END= /DNA_ORIENTATION=